MVAFLRVWQPGDPLIAEGGGGRAARDRRRGHRTTPRTRRRCAAATAPGGLREDIIGAYAPYMIIIVVFALAQWGPIKDFLAKGATEFAWPGPGHPQRQGRGAEAVTFKFNWRPRRARCCWSAAC